MDSRKPDVAPSSLPAGQEWGMQTGDQPGERELTLPPACTYPFLLTLTIKTKLLPFNAAASSNGTCNMSVHETPVSLRNVSK